MTTLLTMKGFNKTVTPLCFTANTANSTVQLTKTGSPTAVNLETSTDGATWADYTISNTITLSNIWDKVYFRNKSETPTGFSLVNNYYKFVMSWSVAASWDINYLLCKNSTDTLTDAYCFYVLFNWCTSLTTPPKLRAMNLTSSCYYSMFKGCTALTTCPELPATTIDTNCYREMFAQCSSLTAIPTLKATTLLTNCYQRMFNQCTSIKLSTTQTWEYQTPYRIPATWTWTDGTDSLQYMFNSTWWTFTWTPSINTTYYTSNTLV